MPNRIVSYFNRIEPLTDKEKEAILDGIKVVQFKKGEFLIKAGQYLRQTYFVLEGCVRQYFIVDGIEKTTNFFVEDQWILSTGDPNDVKPSNFSLRFIENTLLVVGDEERSKALLSQFPKFQDLSRRAIQNEYDRQRELSELLITKTPEQRYSYILERQPGLIDRIPLYHLASYIGITPESLSRIRKRLAT
jgi:CRP-like cAMP-binding protein